MIKLFLSFFIIGSIFSSTNLRDDSLAIVPYVARTSQAQYDPYADMHLSQYPGHPNPPIYEITFPGGQKLLICGTIHNVPLGCILPYQLAQGIIEASDFTINEVVGELLPGGVGLLVKNTDVEDPEFDLYMTPKRTGQTSELDENDRYYARAGIEITSEQHTSDDITVFPKLSMYPKKLKINGINYQVPSRNGMELHPLALNTLSRYFTRASCYIEVASGGVDDDLYSLARQSKRYSYCFENDSDRFGRGYMNQLSEEIDEYISNIYTFKRHINELKKDWAVQEKRKEPTIDYAVDGDLYSDCLPICCSSGTTERNDLWIKRLVKLNEKTFRQAFAYVGRGHLHDLFEKLKELGFTVSERVSLAKLDEILLDEDCVVTEHAARKTAMQAAFGATH